MSTQYAHARFNLNSPGKIAALLAALVFSWLCYFYQVAHGICCDASTYMDLGGQLLTRGIQAESTGLRLYGYPLFISFCIDLADLLRLHASFLLYLVQTGLYLLAVCRLSSRIATAFSARAADVCYFALLGNVLIYPYLAIPLTDGLSVVVLLFIFDIALKLFSAPHPLALDRSSALQHGAIGFLLGFAVMLRPANISWLLLVVPLVGAWWWQAGQRWQATAGQVLALACGFGLAIAPQLQLNWTTFQRFTFLPTKNLGDQQIQWGIAYAKYATTMIGTPAGLIYANPYGQAHADGVLWYLHNPLDGARTIFLHLFAAFDFDYFFPYIYGRETRLRPLLFLFSHGVVFWSIAGYAIALSNLPMLPVLRRRALLGAALIAALTIGWLAVHAASAVENRFTLPVITCMLPLAAWMLASKLWNLRSRNILLGTFALYLLFAWQMSSFLSGLTTI